MARTRIPLSKSEETARILRERLEMSTAEIGLTVRTTNCLEERGIFTVRDLLNCTPEDLLNISNFGEKTLEEVYQALADFGFPRKKNQLAGAPMTSTVPSAADINRRLPPANATGPAPSGSPTSNLPDSVPS
jgi:DNA-directed RNA polymerase subunit alpha